MVDLNLHQARGRFLILAAVATASGLLSAFGARDGVVWCLEVLPVFVVGAVVWLRGWAPSGLLGTCLFLHALVLIVGAHYTYAEVPAGRWVADLLGQSRNPYDRLGHFMQGLVPALIMREAVLRTATVASFRNASFAGVLFAGTFTAAYEIFEWFAAVALGQGADAFLGTQGFVWDTQADMLCALVGAAFGMVVLALPHRRSLSALDPRFSVLP